MLDEAGATDMVVHDSQKMAARRWRKLFARMTPAARLAMMLSSFGSVSCLVGAVLIGAIAAAVVIILLGIAVTTVLLAAMLGTSDATFNRLMALLGVSTGRPPGNYVMAAGQPDSPTV